MGTRIAYYEATLYPAQSLNSKESKERYVNVNIGLQYYIEMTQLEAYNYINKVIKYDKDLEYLTKSIFGNKETNQTLPRFSTEQKKETFAHSSKNKNEQLRLPCIEIKEEY